MVFGLAASGHLIGLLVKPRRRQVGLTDVKLLVDANCAYRSYEAIQFAEKIEEFDIFWFEEPVMPDDYDGSPTSLAP